MRALEHQRSDPQVGKPVCHGNCFMEEARSGCPAFYQCLMPPGASLCGFPAPFPSDCWLGAPSPTAREAYGPLVVTHIRFP